MKPYPSQIESVRTVIVLRVGKSPRLFFMLFVLQLWISHPLFITNFTSGQINLCWTKCHGNPTRYFMLDQSGLAEIAIPSSQPLPWLQIWHQYCVEGSKTTNKLKHSGHHTGCKQTPSLVILSNTNFLRDDTEPHHWYSMCAFWTLHRKTVRTKYSKYRPSWSRKSACKLKCMFSKTI